MQWQIRTVLTVDILIRPARSVDIPRMAELLKELFTLEADFSPDVEKQVHGLSALVADPSGRSLVLVADQAGSVVGMATVQTLISTAEGGRVGVVEDVIVAATHRRKGIGCLLLAEIETWSRRKGLKRLQLLADRENLSAIDFYSRCGWSKTSLICLRNML